MNAMVQAPAEPANADLERLLEITRQLRGGFERDEWAGAGDLEAERRAIIERVFDERPTAAELPRLTATLREVVRLNEELIGLAEHRRRALGREIDTATLGSRAGHAYRSHSPGSPRGPRL